jgi:hypothetical protein
MPLGSLAVEYLARQEMFQHTLIPFACNNQKQYKATIAELNG